MVYVDLYFPKVAQGMNVRIGRYISLPDIEAQLAPNNYTYSHSLLYTFDCYTQTGVNTTAKLSNHWMVQPGVSAGCDVAPWVGGPEAKVHSTVCLGYTWSQGGDNLYFCDNSTERRQVRLQQSAGVLRSPGITSSTARGTCRRKAGTSTKGRCPT